MLVTETEAQNEKWCPQTMTPEGARNCCGCHCMAWRWNPNWKPDDVERNADAIRTWNAENPLVVDQGATAEARHAACEAHEVAATAYAAMLPQGEPPSYPQGGWEWIISYDDEEKRLCRTCWHHAAKISVGYCGLAGSVWITEGPTRQERLPPP